MGILIVALVGGALYAFALWLQDSSGGVTRKDVEAAMERRRERDRIREQLRKTG